MHSFRIDRTLTKLRHLELAQTTVVPPELRQCTALETLTAPKERSAAKAQKLLPPGTWTVRSEDHVHRVYARA